MNGRAWTSDEDAFLKANYRVKSNGEVARKLLRTPEAVQCRLNHSGLSRTLTGKQSEEVKRRYFVMYPSIFFSVVCTLPSDKFVSAAEVKLGDGDKFLIARYLRIAALNGLAERKRARRVWVYRKARDITW